MISPATLPQIRNAKRLLVVTLLWFLLVVAKSSNVGRTLLFQVFIVYWGGIILGVCWSWFAVAGATRMFGKAGGSRFVMLTAAQALLFGAGLFVNHSDVVFNLRFALSRTALEQYCSTFPVGEKRRSTHRVGLFTARETEQLTNCVRIITCSAGMADDAGLVYCPTGKPPVLGEDGYRHLSGPWWKWHRSW